MEIVNIKENEEKQKNIVFNLSKILKERCLAKEDTDMLKNSVMELIKLECGAHMIDAQFEEIDNPPPYIKDGGITIGFSSESEDINKDVCIGFDVKYFYENFFTSPNYIKRASGLIQMLISLYHEIEHSKQSVFIKRSRLRPKTLEMAYEMVVKSLEDETFYDLNYDRLTSEAYAELNGRFNTLELISSVLDKDVIEKSKIIDEISDAISLSNSKIGKIYKSGKLESKDSFFRRMCDIYIKKYPNTLYNYPVLQKVYNENGKRKDLEQIFEQMIEDGRKIIRKYYSLDKDIVISMVLQQEYLECTAFYFEVIEPLIEEANENDYKAVAKKFGVYNLQSFLGNMEQYFNNKASEKVEYSKFVRDMNLKNDLLFDREDEIESTLKKQINAIVRFENGCTLNKIAEKLLREGGHVRGTRENLLPDVKKRRQMFANSLIRIYDNFETEKDYENRAYNEKDDIDEVVDALYFNRFEGFMKNKTVDENKKDEFGNEEVVRIAQLLKIAKILSRDSKRDYYNEFLMIPEVNEFLILMEKDKNGYLRECLNNGINGVKNFYPETEAEQGKYKEYITCKNETNENISKIIMLNEELPKVNQRNKDNRYR